MKPEVVYETRRPFNRKFKLEAVLLIKDRGVSVPQAARDQGSKYTSEHFQQLLKEQGVTCSLCRACEVWGNSAMESFFSSLKTERTARKVHRFTQQARADVFDYIERLYNPTRHHSTIGYVSLIQLEEARKA